MNICSLFDGFSGAQLALHKAGIPVTKYYASEVDEYAITVTQRNFPDTIQLGDVKDVAGINFCYHKNRVLVKDDIDLLIGGSPCQGFSFASKDHLNFDDPRSSLFFEYVRLLKELKPKWFLLENVKMKMESEKVISDLLGVEPIEINSNLMSAQNRKRLYWTNIPTKTPIDKGIFLKDIIENGYVDREKSCCIDANYSKGGNLKSYFEKSRRQLVFSDLTYTKYRKLSVTECERLQTVPDGYTMGVSNTQRYKMLGNGFTVDVIAHILRGMVDICNEIKVYYN